MVDCSKYVCDVHFLLIWLLLIKDYTTNNLIKVWHWIDQIIFVYSLSKFLPRNHSHIPTLLLVLDLLLCLLSAVSAPQPHRPQNAKSKDPDQKQKQKHAIQN